MTVIDVNPLFQSYILYASILAVKMLVMSPLTGRQRFRKLAFANPEDAKSSKNAKVRVDEDVERVRRAHLNDLENISVFFVVAAFYILTNPSIWLATTLFRVYTLARVLHTLVYAVCVVPQPARALSWAVGYGITLYMVFNVICHFWAAL